MSKSKPLLALCLILSSVPTFGDDTKKRKQPEPETLSDPVTTSESIEVMVLRALRRQNPVLTKLFGEAGPASAAESVHFYRRLQGVLGELIFSAARKDYHGNTVWDRAWYRDFKTVPANLAERLSATDSYSKTLLKEAFAKHGFTPAETQRTLATLAKYSARDLEGAFRHLAEIGFTPHNPGSEGYIRRTVSRHAGELADDVVLRGRTPATAESLSAAERTKITRSLTRQGLAGAEVASGLSKGARILRVGGRIFFWVGVAMMVYDGATGSVEAVKNGDPLVDWMANEYPAFAFTPIFAGTTYLGTPRDYAAATTGFARGVGRGFVAPAQAAYESIATDVHQGLVKMLPKGSPLYHAARVTKEDVAMEKRRPIVLACKKAYPKANCDYYWTHDPVDSLKVLSAPEAMKMVGTGGGAQ